MATLHTDYHLAAGATGYSVKPQQAPAWTLCETAIGVCHLCSLLQYDKHQPDLGQATEDVQYLVGTFDFGVSGNAFLLALAFLNGHFGDAQK